MLANLGSIGLTVQEAIRYRGRSGHYTWLAHRLSGLGILGFLLIHVWDGSMLTFNPKVYTWTLALFKHPLFGIGEIVVFGCVIFHAFNGLRISLLDWKPSWWKFQNASATAVWIAFAALFIPLAIMLFMGTLEACGHPPVWPNGVEARTCLAFPPPAAFDLY